MPNESVYKDWNQDYGGHFPGSNKVYVEKDGLKVPMREIPLTGKEKPIRVYDTSGPLCDSQCGRAAVAR